MDTTPIKDLWARDLYINESFDYLISKKITEYDMKDAGYNLAKYFDLLSKSKLEYLSKLEKHRRRVQIGIYMREDQEFNKSLTESFGKIRKLFMEENDLSQDDILSIKKDAIFVISKRCDHTSYGNVMFCEKNVYSSYHRFGNIEMLYKYSNNTIDVKGINDNLLYQHKYMLGILKRLFRLLETCDYDEFVKLMKKFVDDYKNCRLAYGYYRELKGDGQFALVSKDTDHRKYYIPNIVDDSFDDCLDISYNFMNYVLPMIQRFYFPFDRK